ncbi:hypothetical protein DSO57_1035758 [Entomophthora muscae]|uniref:Uncharacterized protein n=1 Tax=Entomophthora muscae TaxID=34485 RepID=A0ACC2RQG8_9FUNG|nr:hypothetical protein DSO57_1035758 [Entomophthora muscae]
MSENSCLGGCSLANPLWHSCSSYIEACPGPKPDADGRGCHSSGDYVQEIKPGILLAGWHTSNTFPMAI